jgi:IS1 family transposase
MLCEGTSMRAIARLMDCSFTAIVKVLVDAGQFCASYHSNTINGVKSKRVQCDEIWSFTYAKQKNVAKAKQAPEWAGDTWTWTALDADSKLLISWMVGGRDAKCAKSFMDDVAGRLANRVQLTTDGLKSYLDAAENAFGADIDFAQLVKLYGESAEQGPERKYSPSVCIGSKTFVVSGQPDLNHVSTSHVERQNLTMRMHMRRFTRLTNGFSKKVQNHAWMVALYTVYYNFLKVHSSLRVTPAMEAGFSGHAWTFGELAGMIEESLPKPGPRGPYKKKAA